MVRVTNTNLYLTGIILVLLLVIGYMYFYLRQNKTEQYNEKETPKVQPQESVDTKLPEEPSREGLPQHMINKPCMTMFHADWCPHCKHLLPEWETVKKSVAGRHLLADIESKNPMMKNFNLKGYPTIRYFPQGLNNPSVFVEYSGDRTAADILKFLSDNQK